MTKPKNYGEFVTSLASKSNYDIPHDVLHAAMGISTEAAEILDIVKKGKFYGKPWNRDQLEDELGDVLFYVQLLSNWLERDLNYLIQVNVSKLSQRYENGFSEEAAKNPNKAKEAEKQREKRDDIDGMD